MHTQYTPLWYCKTGVHGDTPLLLIFWLQHIDCGYMLEPPWRNFPMKNQFFTVEKN